MKTFSFSSSDILRKIDNLTMKLAATVILFNPEVNFIHNILSYSGVADELYIVDNSKTSSIKNDCFKLITSRFIYLHDGENEGIAKRLNQVCSLAKQNGADWLLTMDQDSEFEDSELSEYLSCINQFPAIEEVAMFGVNSEQRSTNHNECKVKETSQLITSGSVINLRLFNAIGGFDENLFIDEVDFEYCLRAKLKGYKTIKFSNIYLNHTLGKTSYHHSLKTLKSSPRTLHSPIRLYYITRNFFYIRKKYGQIFREDLDKRRKSLLNRIKNNLLYNKNRFLVMKYMVLAIIDFNHMRMGKKA